MKRRRSAIKLTAEAVLSICAVIIWGYDLNLAFTPNDVTYLDFPIQQPRPALTTQVFPWHSGSLPRIPWNPFPPQEEQIAPDDQNGQEQPGLLLQGLCGDGQQRGAIIRDVESGLVALLLEGEQWNGITLKEVGKGWVRVESAGSVWKLSMPTLEKNEK